MKVLKLCSSCLLLSMFMFSSALALNSVNKSRQDLDYGTVLYEFYQDNYFRSLIEQEYVESLEGNIALTESAQVLKGGMQVSYGLPNDAFNIFNGLLDKTESQDVRNSAWFYLAKLYYIKNENEQARKALDRVKGDIPRDLNIDYHYLTTLVNTDGKYLNRSQREISKVKEDLPEYPYFLFNLAIGYLFNGDIASTNKYLEEVITYAYLGEEFQVLADRAKHGLALISLDQKNLTAAWEHLSTSRTTGLYSNRAMLSYAWTAIKLEQFKEAIPALQILNERSIAAPEVQETKVLLAHLYEQDGLSRKALKQNILAEQEFEKGLAMVDDAREILKSQDIPREFITNLETVVRETDWYGERPEINYENLTPFLIDLLSANRFQETLKELADLYAIEHNLVYWLMQTEQHSLVLKESLNKNYSVQAGELIQDAASLREEFLDKESESKLMTLTLEEKDQVRFTSLLQNTAKELNQLDATVFRLRQVKEPYQPPIQYASEIVSKEKTIIKSLKRTREYIVKLEKVMRTLANLELNKHESRMKYYWAQSKLAKARLYDATLTTLNKAKREVQSTQEENSSERKNK